MKILQVYKDIFPEVNGGIERYIHDLSLFLSSRGHHVEILAAGGGERMVKGIPVHGVPEACRILSNPVAPGYMGYLKKTNADIVHFHLPLPSSVTAWQMISRKRITPWVVTYHSDIVRQAFLMPLYAPVLRKFLRGASTVMATSGIYAETSPYLNSLNNTEVIPIGVDLCRFTPSENPSRDFYLFVGRFRKYKGIITLLDSWRGMKNPPPLVMAGGGSMESDVRRIIRTSSIPVTVRTDVSDDELVKLYGNAKALILPSTLRSEAYGMVQLEAMACGTPVISSDLSTGVSWVNRHGETGYTFKTGSPEALSEAVERIERSDLSAAEMGAAARKRAEAFFNSQDLFAKVEKCLLKAAENSHC